MNKLQWNFNRNSNIFIQENAFESVISEMAAILSRPHCVKANKHTSSHLLYGRVYPDIEQNTISKPISVLNTFNQLYPKDIQPLSCNPQMHVITIS